MAHSSTSTGALALGIALMLMVGFDFVNRQRIGTYLVVTAVVCVSAEWLFGIHNLALYALGRDSTLTGRTDVWHMLLNWDINPIFGVGFESFWQENRMAQIEAMAPGLVINESHNGYLETYINMGLLGVAITLAMLFATFWKARRALLDNFDFGRFRFAYLAAFIIYNWTEAAFRTHSVPFFMFFLIAIDYPSVWESESVTEGVHPSETDEEAVHKGDIPAHG
jgi:O-antigen ligase